MHFCYLLEGKGLLPAVVARLIGRVTEILKVEESVRTALGVITSIFIDGREVNVI